jgi:hypothetical protein
VKALALSDKHVSELALAVSRALQQWLPGAVPAPHDVVQGLERVLLFLRQNGSPSPQSRQVASLAFCWGDQLVREGGFHWASVSEDDSTNPSVVSNDGTRACMVVDAVTMLVMQPHAMSLTALFRALANGELPEMPGCVPLLRDAEQAQPNRQPNP